MPENTPHDEGLEALEQIPQPPPRKGLFSRWLEVDERSQLERNASQSHNIKRFAAYGALAVAALLYLVGVWVVLGITGFLPNRAALAGEQWHIATLAVLALFSVPTVLTLAVLRRTDSTEASETREALPHEWLGQKVSVLLDKLIDKL